MKLFIPYQPPRATLLYERLAERLLDRLNDVTRKDFPDALWIGGDAPASLMQIKNIRHLITRIAPTESDNDLFPFDAATLDLIIVCGALDTVNDLPGALIQMRRALKPDGLFICALPGGETLHELRDSISRVELEKRGGAAPRIHPMIDLQAWAALLQRAGFGLPVADAEIMPVSYQSLPTLLRDLKGAGGLRLIQKDKHFVGKDFWRDVESDYRARHRARDGHLDASFEILYGIGWGPSDNQQKPLRPGSAQNRLADALNAEEKPLPR